MVNLAHGAFYAFGAYLTVTVTAQLGFSTAFVVTPVVVGITGVIIEMLCIRKLYPKDPILTLLFAFGLAMAKRAVNRTQDIQGYQSSLEAAFDMHQLGHGNCLAATGKPIFVNLEEMKKVTKEGGKS